MRRSLSAVLVLGLVVGACGGDDTETAAPGPDETATADASETEPSAANGGAAESSADEQGEPAADDASDAPDDEGDEPSAGFAFEHPCDLVDPEAVAPVLGIDEPSFDRLVEGADDDFLGLPAAATQCRVRNETGDRSLVLTVGAGDVEERRQQLADAGCDVSAAPGSAEQGYTIACDGGYPFAEVAIVRGDARLMCTLAAPDPAELPEASQKLCTDLVQAAS